MARATGHGAELGGQEGPQAIGILEQEIPPGLPGHLPKVTLQPLGEIERDAELRFLQTGHCVALSMMKHLCVGPARLKGAL